MRSLSSCGQSTLSCSGFSSSREPMLYGLGQCAATTKTQPPSIGGGDIIPPRSGTMKDYLKREKKWQPKEEKEVMAHLIAVSSERNPASSSSDGALLAFREPWREVCFEPAGELVREASREAALRETVLPLSKIWRRRSGMVEGRLRVGLSQGMGESAGDKYLELEVVGCKSDERMRGER